MINLKNKARHSSFFQKLVVSTGLALFVQCSPVVAQNSGVLVLYREKLYAMSAIKAKIQANGQEICRVKSNSKTTVKINSGDYVLQAKPNLKHPISVKVAPNDTVFIKIYVQMGIHSGTFKFSLMDKRQGKLESDLLKEMEK